MLERVGATGGSPVDGLSEAFGDRVAERVTLLTTQLRSSDPRQRADALYPARRLIWNWRGSYAQLIAQVGEQLRGGRSELWEPAVLVRQNLRRLGAPAADGLLARLKDSPILQIAAAAAAARWHGAADAGPALSLVARYLDSDGHWEKRAALDLLVEIGPVGGHHAAPLHRLLAPGNRWLRVSAAGALWRVAGDAEAVLPVFGDLWRSEPGLRGVVAAAYAEMGAAAEPARPLLLEEIGRPRRHNVQEHSGTSHQVIDDEKLLDDCRTVLAA